MTYNPDHHHRRSIRLRDYDYSGAGAYFITICSWKKECLFGEIGDGEMLLNECGEFIMKCWDTIPAHFPHVETDEFIVMPNHVHGIIVLSDVGAQFIASSRKAAAENQGIPGEGAMNHAPTKGNGMKIGIINHAPTVGEIVRAFKARCTHAITTMRKTSGVPVWQRNYYEHVIRNERELGAIREYIRLNPLKWNEDEESPGLDNSGTQGQHRL